MLRSSALPTIPRPQPSCEFPRVPRSPARRATAPRRRRDLSHNQITGTIPTEIGLLKKLTHLRVPPASPTRGAARDRPRRRRRLDNNKITGTIPTNIAHLTKLYSLRVPSASPTSGAARGRPIATQEPRGQPDHRQDPARLRPAHGACVPASSPRVPDARRGARTALGVAGTSRTTRSKDRSRTRSASSRRWCTCEFPPRPRRPTQRANGPRRRRYLQDNQIEGSIPNEIGQLAALDTLRVPPASPTPGPARDRPSASQVARRQQDHRHDPERPLRGPVLLGQVWHQPRRAVRLDGLLRSRGQRGMPSYDLRRVLRSQDHDIAASSLRVPDARRGARPLLGVAGPSTTTGSTTRSRPRSASSRR